METVVSYLSQSAAPDTRPCETIDARGLPSSRSLRNTLDQLTEIDESIVLVQVNHRRPRRLYPKLDDRRYDYETFEDGDVVVTVIWSDRETGRR